MRFFLAENLPPDSPLPFAVQRELDIKDLAVRGYPKYTYCHPLVAVLLDPIHHANFWRPKMFRVEPLGPETAHFGETYFEPTRLRLVEEIEVPTITLAQRVRIAILFARPDGPSLWNDGPPTMKDWADDWLSGRDRSAQRADCMDSPHFTPDMAKHCQQIGVSTTPNSAASKARLAAGCLARHDPVGVCKWTAISIVERFREPEPGTVMDLLAIADQAMRDEAQYAPPPPPPKPRPFFARLRSFLRLR